VTSQSNKFQAIKGVRDILPPESALWNRVEQTAREVFATYGYGEIRLPIFEETELFVRSIGGATDIVGKEMYTFATEHDRESTSENAPERTLSLRPEATASVVRAYIEHGMQMRPGNTKLYYVGPMFRRERPQKGRYRQFYQIGAELLGSSDHPAIDAEVIEMLLMLFARLRLQGAVLHLNSIGDKNCRPAYIERLRAELEKVRDTLGPDSQRRIETNPLRVLDSKVPQEQAVIATLPRIADYLCPECREHYAELKKELTLRSVPYEEDWRLVRGLDYYMRTTFEITAPGLGSQNAVCGGGRYDGLVELLGGPPTKGIGFAIGTDRLVLSLEESEKRASVGESVAKASEKPSAQARGAGIDVFLAWFGAATYPTAVALARKLRELGVGVELPAVEMKFGKSLSLADRLGARYAVILGEEELAAKQFTVKRLADADQRKLSEVDLLAYLASDLAPARTFSAAETGTGS
jgi:histidyl-tRNA synthetase